MNLTKNEKELLRELLSEKLQKNWRQCDRAARQSDYAEYERLTNECSLIKKLATNLNIDFEDYIAARF